MSFHLFLSILPLIGNAVLGCYLLMKNPRSKISYAFCVMVSLLVGWSFTEIMMRIQSEPEVALFWGKILYVNAFFLPSSFLVLSYLYTGGKKGSYVFISYLIGFIFIPFLYSDQFITKIIEIPPWGYDIEVGPLFLPFAFLYLSIVAGGAGILLNYYSRSPPQERHRLYFMLIGFIISVILIGISNFLFRMMGWQLPRAGSIFTLVATISFAYGMVKHQLLIVPTREKVRETVDSRCGAFCSICTAYLNGECPSCEMGDAELREACPIYRCSLQRGVSCNNCNLLLRCTIYREYGDRCPFTTDRYGLKSQTSYLLKDDNPQIAFEIFKDYTIRGSFGLLITRDYPEKVIKRYNLPKISVIWLSQIEEHETSIDPSNLPRLTHIISQFIHETPLSFVFMVGLEYLIVHNGFEKVLKHLHMINDQVMTHDSRFLIVMDPKTLDPREMSLLEREMHSLEKENLFKSSAKA